MKDKAKFFKEIFDAMPSMVFVVDSNVKIQEFNRTASDFFKLNKDSILKQRGGNMIHCIHSGINNDQCGYTEACEKCVIRNSVRKALDGNKVSRVRTKLEIIQDDNRTEIYALITTSPLEYENEKMALLVIEDISIIAELKRLIPICSMCHKIRDENNVWSRIEAYFKENWDVDFTHGICPDCHKKEIERVMGKRENTR